VARERCNYIGSAEAEQFSTAPCSISRRVLVCKRRALARMRCRSVACKPRKLYTSCAHIQIRTRANVKVYANTRVFVSWLRLRGLFALCVRTHHAYNECAAVSLPCLSFFTHTCTRVGCPRAALLHACCASALRARTRTQPQFALADRNLQSRDRNIFFITIFSKLSSLVFGP